MAKRQYTVVFTCDSAKLGDALAELKYIGVENLGFDLLQARMVPPHLTEPGAKPTRSAVVMQPRALPKPKKDKVKNGPRTIMLVNGKNASQTVVDYVRTKGELGADPKEIAEHIRKLGYNGGKGSSTIAPTLVYSGRLKRDYHGPNGRTRYFVNEDYVPRRAGKKSAHDRPDLYAHTNNGVTGE